jgi:Xaa-Pro dipeptidase
MNLPAIQEHMRDQRIDAWLVYDFRGSNPVLAQLIGGKRHLTRRVMLCIPAQGEPRLLVHHIDAGQFRNMPMPVDLYLTWQDLRAWVMRQGEGRSRLAMEYAPGGGLPAMGIVDAGTIELVRSAGVDVVSSADLVQTSVAIWSAAAIENHAVSGAKTGQIMADAWSLIRDRLAAGSPVHEIDVQRFIMGRFEAQGLETPDPPICAVNAHSGDPHFEITPDNSAPIRKGDWVLIDLWARVPGEENPFSDITWMGYAGPTPPEAHAKVYAAVKAARDAAVDFVRDAWNDNRRLVQGWQVDDASRDQIVRAGFAHGIKHRTGHSLSGGTRVHGVGVNIDNLETRDTRTVLPGVGFTVEPGVYLPEFGVRLEIDVYMHPANGPVVTSCIQDDIVRLA